MIHLFSDRSRAVNAGLLPLLDFSSNSCAAIPILCALKLCSALAMLLTTAMARKTPFRLYVTHFDRHVMAADSKATICRHHDAVTRKRAVSCVTHL
jgi:hypothetical protein